MPAALMRKDEMLTRLMALFREKGFDGASCGVSVSIGSGGNLSSGCWRRSFSIAVTTLKRRKPSVSSSAFSNAATDAGLASKASVSGT